MTIEHVGSTAVPTLAAKSIIDVDVLLASEARLLATIECLGRFGDIHPTMGSRTARLSLPLSTILHITSMSVRRPVRSFGGISPSETTSALTHLTPRPTAI